ncbi:hypothetical protein SLEP1_g28416 [Rubroshorea leprosula]|uniref:Uncharacterized protein n=1 Tax=Rubroshorea leprosula TaxID=152421 RepID=A0AAV5JTR5_9ROSI|nr:hypothetical protein SLEP1_g28416 [Rubroshorea leprosula]
MFDLVDQFFSLTMNFSFSKFFPAVSGPSTSRERREGWKLSEDIRSKQERKGTYAVSDVTYLKKSIAVLWNKELKGNNRGLNMRLICTSTNH